MPGLLSDVAIRSLAAWRVTRFIVKDGLIDAQRDWALKRLLGDGKWTKDFDGDVVPEPLAVANDEISKPRLKLHELATCPYCMSVWVSIGVTLIARRRREPQVLVTWLAVCGAVMAWWRLIEPD